MLRSIITLSLAGLCTAAGHKGTVSWVAGTGATPEITTVTAGESHVSTGQAWVNVPDWLADANVHTLVGHTTAGNTLRLDCPATADDRPCHFTFVYYFCPPCGVSTNGGLPPLFGANGFTGGSCAARYVATSGGDTKDTVFWTKVLTSGSFLELELSGGLEHASVWDVSNGQCITHNTQVTPTLLAVNAFHASGPGSNVIDGSVATGWNAGDVTGWNVPNWASFDFGAPQLVTSFSFYSAGDVTHDVKNWELQVSATGTGGWTTVASGVGVSGSDAEQTTTFDGTVSQFWRFYIPTRYTGYQAYVREVVFRSNVVTPALLAVNADHPSGPGSNVIDGSVATHWNAGDVVGWNVPNWASFDFGAPQLVTSFSFYSVGDVTHDVKDWELQVSATGTGGWTTVASGVGVSGSSAEQTTTFDGAVSQFWRFYILTTSIGYQAYVREVVFHSSHACNLPVCVNRGPAPPRVCLPCLPSLI